MTNEQVFTLFARIASGHELMQKASAKNVRIDIGEFTFGPGFYAELYSYGLCIARYYQDAEPRFVEIYNVKRSRTTSRHISNARRALAQRQVTISEIQ